MGKKGKKNMSEEDYLASLAGEEEEEEMITPTIQPKPQKKKNNKKVYLSEEELSDNEEEVIASIKPKQQKKKPDNKKPKSAFELLEELEDEGGNTSDNDNNNNNDDEDDDDDDDIVIATKPSNKNKKNANKKAPAAKKGKKGKNDDDYLASLAAADEEEQGEEPVPAASTAEKKKKSGKAAATSAKKDEEEDDEDDGGIPLDQRDPLTLSAKEKKKLKKMRQKEAQKEEKKPAEKKKEEKKKDEKKKEDKKKPAEDEKKEEKKKAAPKKVNAGVAALRAAMEKKKQEEERLRLEEERRIREEERALKLIEEQRKQEELAKQRAKEEKKKLENELKKSGQWKSKKQLEEEKRAKARAEAFIAMGLVPGTGGPSNNKSAAKKKAGAAKNKPAAQKPKAKPQEQAKKVEEKQEPKKEEKTPTPVEEQEDNIFLDEEEETPVQEKEESEDEGVEDWEELEDVLEDKVSKEEELKKKKEQEALKKKQAAAQAEKELKKKEEEQKGEDEEESANKHKGHSDLRSPICCVLGHVDTGKTKLLDKIRNTNVQTGEAGGITQQIGATYVPIDAVKRQTKKLNEMTKGKLQYNLPGLLIIDTPGHESFTNLRSRGSSLCDIAILVVDILHGLERQTLESLQLLRQRKTPFIVALNKIDTIYGWKASPNSPIKETLKNQSKHTLEQFDENVRKTIALFNGEGFNAELYYKNKDVQNYVSLVPTSAVTGEGLPDLLALMCQLCQKHMVKRITLQSKFQCTILEVKVIDGHGTTIDVILSNGLIREGDRIVVCTLNGPVVTTIRALLTPQPLKELRVKGEYMHHKEIRASQGIKISAPDLEGAVAGSQVLLVRDGDDVDELKEEVMSDLNDMLSRIAKTGKGVYVQSSTLGSLEALLEFLHSEKIPVSGINIGPVHKKDIVKTSVMLETHPEYAVLLAFDVPVSREAEEEAQRMGVKIFTADIIYHLFDKFMEHTAKVKEEKKKNTEKEVVWPCILKISESNIFRQKDPITVGVDVVEGILRINTPLIIPSKNNLTIGRVIGIQHQKVSLREAERGKSVAIQIDSGKTIQYGRHFTHTDLLYSRLTRDSIDMLKELFGDELKKDKELLLLIVKIKKILGVQ